MTSSFAIPCRLDRRPEQKGSRHPVSSQAGLEKFATGCDGLSPSTINGTRRSTEKETLKKIGRTTRSIKLATINVRTCQDDMKLAEIVKTASQLKLDVLAMQETRRTSSGMCTLVDKSINGWQLIWSGHKRKRQHGVALLLAPHVILEEHNVFLDARIVTAKVRVGNMRLALLNAYAPTEANGSDSAKSGFYSALNKAMKALERTPKFKIITFGDFNATISSHSKNSGAWDSVLGYNNSDRVTTNNNGERFLSWCHENQMKIVNSMFRTKRIHRATWQHAATGKWKRLDYICTTAWVLKFVKSCRVYIGPSKMFDSDHRLLVMNVNFPCSKKNLKAELLKGRRRDRIVRRDFNILRDAESKRQELTERLEENLSTVEANDVDTLNSAIVAAVRQSAEEVCPLLDVVQKKEPWEDAHLQELVDKVKKCKSKDDVKTYQKRVKEYRKKLKNEYFRDLADSINTVAEARQTDKEFALAKKYSMLNNGEQSVISKNKLKTHFQGHFAERPHLEMPKELQYPQRFPHLTDDSFEIREDEPSEAEVKKAINSFKNNKSAGTDKMKTECLKYNNSSTLLAYLVLLMSLIWSSLKVPGTWLHSEVTCLFKKGSRLLASNYRGISIGTNMSRILSKVIIDRLQDAYEFNLSNFQFGFRKNRSTTDGIFIMKNVIDKHKDPFVAVYIDLTAAYDHIPRDFLFKVLELRTGATFLLSILKLMYVGTTASIKGMKSAFEVLVGCRQGGQESPVLFNYYFDFVLKVAAAEIDEAFPEGWGLNFPFNIHNACSDRDQREEQKNIGTEIIKWILYADDVVLFAKNAKDAEIILNILYNTCLRYGLNVSFKKTKTQVFHDKELAAKPSLINVNGNDIENVREFTYLGHVFSNEDPASSIDYRISRANAKFQQLKEVLCDPKVNKKTRWKLMESCVAPRLLYGLQACFPSKQQMKKIEACWHQLLRSMVRGGWKRVSNDPENPDFRYVLTNKSIERILKCNKTIRGIAVSHHMRYFGHVARMRNTSLTKKMMFADPQRLRYSDPWKSIAEMVGVDRDQILRDSQNRSKFREMCNAQPI